MKLISWNICIDKDNKKEVVKYLQSFPDLEYGHYTPYYGSKKKLFFEKYLQNPGSERFGFGGLVQEGNMMLSNLPIKKHNNIDIFHKYETLEEIPNRDHARVAQKTVFNDKDKKFLVITLHGIYNPNKKGNKDTLLQIQKMIETSGMIVNLPAIIVGDFNLLPNSESIQLMNKHFINLNNKFNIKTTRPLFGGDKWYKDNKNQVIDYIFVSKDVKVNNYIVPNTSISDHLPLFLEYEI